VVCEFLKKILPAQRHAQTECEIGQRLHSRLTSTGSGKLATVLLDRTCATYQAGQRQRQPEQPDEDTDREGDQRRRKCEILQRAHIARGIRADEYEHRDGGNEPEPLQRDPEQHDGQDRDADRPRVKARHRRIAPAAPCIASSAGSAFCSLGSVKRRLLAFRSSA
jgi:hypothetical protein